MLISHPIDGQGLRQTVTEADKVISQGLVPLVARTEAAARSKYDAGSPTLGHCRLEIGFS